MIEKQCQFAGEDRGGIHVHLLHPGYDDSIAFLKEAQASTQILSKVKAFLKTMNRPTGKVHVLVSALGAGEYWGSNTNGDYFPEQSLIHTPQGWHELGNKMQQMVGAKWEWGFPTFYNAHAFQHHVNKDPARAFGDVVYACWDPEMHRVLLVIAIDRARAKAMGASGVIDKIENGGFPDVSMGCRVPFDLCSICTEWARITGNPKKDLAEHKRRAIRGLSLTTNDYCQHLQFEVGRIYPDGRMVWMWNLHPRFFDLSFVFIGADKSSKVMAKLAAGLCPIRNSSPMCPRGCTQCSPDHVIKSAHVYEVWSREKTAAKRDEDVGAYIKSAKKQQHSALEGMFGHKSEPARQEKQAQYQAFPEFEDLATEQKVTSYFDRKRKSASDISMLKEAFSVGGGSKKLAEMDLAKQAEIIKRIQSHFNKAMPDVEAEEPSIPKEVLDEMGRCPGSLGTASGMGIVLKPREFQRVHLTRMGASDLADSLDDHGMGFQPGGDADPSFRMSQQIIPKIVEALRPLMGMRSALGPPLKRRVLRITIVGGPRPDVPCPDHPVMDKMASAYQAYRQQVLYGISEVVPRLLHDHPEVLEEVVGDLFSSTDLGLVKTGGDVVQSMLGMFPAMYLNRAYMPGPVSGYVEDHISYAGLRAAGALAASGGVA